MHEHYREKGVPKNVEFVTATIGDLPFASRSLDAAVSTRTYHEFASEAVLEDVGRVLRSGAWFTAAD